MRFRAKRWAVFTLSASAALLLLCALAVFLVDPFEHYRESSILPLYDQESYNNPGIARNYDYDAVILGTSMVEMSHPSVIDACFDVTSVKLPMRGSHISQMGWQLTHVLKTHELKLAILAVDAYSMMGQPNDMEEIYDYLWNDDPLDDVNYLFNRDVALVKIPKMLQNVGKPLAAKRDNMYQWTDVVFSIIRQCERSVKPKVMQKSQSLRLGGERRRLSGGVFHQRLHADPVRPGDVRAAALGRHEDARGAAGTDGGSHVSGDFAHHGILEHQRDGRNQDIRVPRSPAYRVFARRAALSARFEHGGGRHGVGAHAEQLRALRQKRRKRGDDGAADAAALSVQNDDGHNCLRIVKSFVNSGNRFRQNRPRPAGCVRCPPPYRKRKTRGFRPPPWRA